MHAGRKVCFPCMFERLIHARAISNDVQTLVLTPQADSLQLIEPELPQPNTLTLMQSSSSGVPLVNNTAITPDSHIPTSVPTPNTPILVPDSATIAALSQNGNSGIGDDEIDRMVNCMVSITKFMLTFVQGIPCVYLLISTLVLHKNSPLLTFRH